MASLAERVKNVVSSGSNRDACMYYDSFSSMSAIHCFTLMDTVDTPIQMEEAAESRVSLSTRHVLGHYSDNAEPNTDLDAEANAGLLTHDSNAVMEEDKEEEETTGWQTPRDKCCGIK